MIGFYDYTVIATYLATVLGVGGIFLAADGLHLPAVFCLLLAGLLVCAVATALVKKPLRAVIIYMAYSIIMSVIWILLEAPDLALTEAAVGAGITGILFFLTLRRIDRIDRDADVEETQGEEEPHEENEATR